MPVSHDHIIKLMQSVNLGDDEGRCAGIAEMGINAFLSEQFTQYIDRLTRLNKLTPTELEKKRDTLYSKLFSTDTKELQTLKEDERKQLVDTLAFLEGVALYLSPSAHSDFFYQPIAQHQIKKITPFVQSKALKDQGGRVDIKVLTGIYNKTELSQWFDSLHKAIKESPTPQNFALSIGSGCYVSL